MCFSIKLVETNMDRPWNWAHDNISKNISMSFITQYINNNWNFNIISRRDNLPFELIQAKPEKLWDWSYLSGLSEKIPLSFIDKFSHKPWDWHYLFRYCKLTIDFIEKYKMMFLHRLFYDRYERILSLNKFIEPSVMKKYKLYSFSELSKHPNLTMDIVDEFADHRLSQWDWSALSCHPNLTPWIVRKYPNKPWKTVCILKNKNLLKYAKQKKSLVHLFHMDLHSDIIYQIAAFL